MKNSKNDSRNIFESIKKEEEKEEKAKKSRVETSVKSEKQVKSATKTPETLAKTTNEANKPQDTVKPAEKNKVAETASENPGINYSKAEEKAVEEPVNNGLLYITPTRKKTRSHRKGFLLSDLALQNLQNEAAKYEISENELINQILEKMI